MTTRSVPHCRSTPRDDAAPAPAPGFGRPAGRRRRRRRPRASSRSRCWHQRPATEHRRCGASSGTPGCPSRSSRRSCSWSASSTVRSCSGSSLAWLVSAYRFPGRRVLELGAGAAAGHARVHPRLRHHLRVRRRRAGADVVARPVRRGRLVPRDPVDAGRDRHALADAVPVRVPDGSGRAARSGRRRLLRRPHARRVALPRRPGVSCCRCCGRRSPPGRPSW